MDATDRRFSLPALLGMITLIAVSLGLIRLAIRFPDVALFGGLGFIGIVGLVAAIGAVIGFLAAGKRGVVAGAFLTLVAAYVLLVVVSAIVVNLTTRN